MNYFVEGLQGSGKSTLITRLSEQHPDCVPIREGEYSPVELAWCAYLKEPEYRELLEAFSSLRPQIEDQAYRENDHATIWAVFSNMIIGLGGTQLLAVVLHLGLNGLWAAMALDEIFRAIVMMIRWCGPKWKNRQVTV